jgi:hypothetical protein
MVGHMTAFSLGSSRCELLLLKAESWDCGQFGKPNKSILRYGRCSYDLYSRRPMWCPYFQWCALCWKLLVSLESPDRHSLLIAVIPIKSLISTEYTDVFWCPHKRKSRGLRSGDRAGQLTGHLYPTHCSPQVWFRCDLTVRSKLNDCTWCMDQVFCSWRRDACSKSSGTFYGHQTSMPFEDILGNEMFGPAVLLNRLLGAVYHLCFLHNVPLLLEHAYVGMYVCMYVYDERSPLCSSAKSS